jgi:uncharacterized membrane protein
MADHIVALAFDSPLSAQEALLAALRLQEQHKLALHDAVFVSRPSLAPAEVTETTDPTPVAAAVPSSLFGALVGTLLAGPIGLIVGGVLAGGTGALAAKLIDTGIPDDVIQHLRMNTKPGQSVLALLVSDVAGAAALEELHRFAGAKLVYAQLPPTALQLVREALHQ